MSRYQGTKASSVISVRRRGGPPSSWLAEQEAFSNNARPLSLLVAGALALSSILTLTGSMGNLTVFACSEVRPLMRCCQLQVAPSQPPALEGLPAGFPGRQRRDLVRLRAGGRSVQCMSTRRRPLPLSIAPPSRSTSLCSPRFVPRAHPGLRRGVHREIR